MLVVDVLSWSFDLHTLLGTNTTIEGREWQIKGTVKVITIITGR